MSNNCCCFLLSPDLLFGHFFFLTNSCKEWIFFYYWWVVARARRIRLTGIVLTSRWPPQRSRLYSCFLWETQAPSALSIHRQSAGFHCDVGLGFQGFRGAGHLRMGWRTTKTPWSSQLLPGFSFFVWIHTAWIVIGHWLIASIPKVFILLILNNFLIAFMKKNNSCFF